MNGGKKSASAISIDSVRARSSSNDFEYYREEASAARIIHAVVKNTQLKPPTYTDIYERNNYESEEDERMNADEHHHEDDEELRRFEKLEQYVDEHPSFRSSTSFVDTLFQSKTNAKSNYDIEETINENDEEEYANQTENAMDAQDQAIMFKMMKELYDKSDGITDMASYNSRLEQLFKEYENYKPNASNENNAKLQSDDSKRSKQNESLDTERRNTSSGSLASSSKTAMSRKVKRINGADSFEASYNENQSSYQEETNTREDNYNFNRDAKYDFNDNSVWLDQTVSNANRNNIYETEGKEKARLNAEKASEDGSNSQMSALINKLFPSIRNNSQAVQAKTQKPEVVVEKVERAQEVNRQSAASGSSSVTSNALVKEKLKQLEIEIEKFQEKNVEIDRLKERLNAEIKLAETSRKMASKQKEEELNKLREMHEEEARKFRLEKKVFEQYKQSVKDMPTRKERDEIEVLKKQVRLLTIF
jgi:hypothetical protein